MNSYLFTGFPGSSLYENLWANNFRPTSGATTERQDTTVGGSAWVLGDNYTRFLGISSTGTVSERMKIDTAGMLITNNGGICAATICSDVPNNGSTYGIKSDGGLYVSNGNATISANIGIGVAADTVRFHVNGSMRNNAFSTGSLVSDSSGNITVSSDERLKDIQGNFSRGLSDILLITPINYKWKASTGYDTLTTYAGFSAQNVQSAIPEAVGEDPQGMLSLSDRPIIAALVNAVKELNEIITGFYDKFTTKEICLGETCIDEQILKDLLEKNSLSAIVSSGEESSLPESTSTPPTSTSTDPVVDEETSTSTATSSATLSSISITTPADKLTYTVGDTLDITGLVVTGTYSDGTTTVETITADNITGFDSTSSATDQVLTITVGEQTTTYTVTINEAPAAATLSSIAITAPATKLTYIIGDTLDISGLEVTGTYSDETTAVESITADNITGFDSSATTTEQTLTITVGDQTTTYSVAIGE